ncbi:MAG TPA: OmpA family protein [Chitinophagales bacterium]|nr:OmpA family protein [Chitinophagales bacterium]
MIKWCIVFFIFLSIGNLNAQTTSLSKKSEKEWSVIRTQLGLRKYEATLSELELFVEKNPEYLIARKFLAESYLYTFRNQEAADFIQKTIQKFQLNDADWWAMQAESYQQLKKYPEAIAALHQLIKVPFLGLPYQNVVKSKIKKLEYTWHMIQNPVPFTPKNLGDVINTSAYELYPFLSPDGNKLYFTRKEKNEDLYYAEKVDDKWSEVYPLPFNTNQNEGAQTVSSNGRLILFTACNHPTGLGSCDIFYSFLINGEWTTPSGIGAPINSTDWDSQPSISANGMSILFSSNRPDGKGGKDLYISYLNKRNQWTEPQNLGSTINTSGDEETPFLHADGRTLYFSSNGHPTVGAKDLYVSRLSDDGIWSTPQNLGYPINTEGDESSIYVALDGKSAFVSSDRPGGQGKLDIYEFSLNDSVQANPATYVQAIVKDVNSKKLLDAQYSVYDFNTNQLFAQGRTFNDGNFLICMPLDKTFSLQIEKDGYVFHSEQFQPQIASMSQPYLLEVDLFPIEQGASLILKNVLFKTDSYELESVSFPELQKLIELLKKDLQIKAVIQGHTDNVGKPAYNLELSQKRAQAVVEYLVKNGIALNRLSAKGFGESQPISTNDTKEGRQLNRRTEFVILGK